ncbi:redoxin family protein [Thauera sp.]|uniref:redoxin family protein n=1 Tax=Thauera sp. TaxID=1905334 RepID=UPI002C4281B4|nr:redoxin family protein [Thauera sp.]HRP25727.1 redoxin family protein [Thauera sp.]
MTNPRPDPSRRDAAAPASYAAAAGKPPRWRRWAVEIVIFVAIFLAIQAWLARDVPAGPAPDFAAVGADGSALSLAAWRAAHPGRAVGVYFWADWCPICTAQEGSIDGIAADHPVLTVAMQSGDAAAVAKVQAERGLDWHTAIDADGRIAQAYGLRGVPAFVVVDAAGDIRSVALGYSTAWGLRARLWWAGLSS